LYRYSRPSLDRLKYATGPSNSDHVLTGLLFAATTCRVSFGTPPSATTIRWREKRATYQMSNVLVAANAGGPPTSTEAASTPTTAATPADRRLSNLIDDLLAYGQFPLIWPDT
jgi:hypothetical protein